MSHTIGPRETLRALKSTLKPSLFKTLTLMRFCVSRGTRSTFGKTPNLPVCVTRIKFPFLLEPPTLALDGCLSEMIVGSLVMMADAPLSRTHSV